MNGDTEDLKKNFIRDAAVAGAMGLGTLGTGVVMIEPTVTYVLDLLLKDMSAAEKIITPISLLGPAILAVYAIGKSFSAARDSYIKYKDSQRKPKPKVK